MGVHRIQLFGSRIHSAVASVRHRANDKTKPKSHCVMARLRGPNPALSSMVFGTAVRESFYLQEVIF